jgi:hypothetical protein
MIESDTRSNDWQALNLWNDNRELYAVAVGDVDHTHPGDEVVVAGESNKVTVVYGFGNTWVAETVFRDNWYVTSIAIGDIYPLHPGNEIVIVGWSTYVTMIYKSTDTGEWVSERLYHDYDWLYDVAIGDIYPEHPGDEIVFVGDPRHVIMLNYSSETDTWGSTIIWDNTPDINVIAIGNFDAFHLGNEVAVSGVNIQELGVREIYYNQSSGKWRTKFISDIAKDPLEMVIGDFYSGHTGDEMALVSIERSVLMIYQNNSADDWVQTRLWQDIESIRDVEIIDILPSRPGNELVVAGYSDFVTIVMESTTEPTGWEHTRIFTGTGNLNGLAFGEFDGFHSGAEFALIQGVGKLLKLQPEARKGIIMFTPQESYSIPAGVINSIPIMIIPQGGYSGPVVATVENESQLSQLGIETDLAQPEGRLPAVTWLEVSPVETAIAGDYEVSLVGRATETEGKTYLNFTITVLSSEAPVFDLIVIPDSGEIVADFSDSFQLAINKLNAWVGTVVLSTRYLPAGMSGSFSESKLQPNGKSELTITTTSATPTGLYFVIITGAAEQNRSIRYSTVLALEILEPTPTFELQISSKTLELPINGSVQLDITGISRFGFSEEVTLSISGLPDGVTSTLAPGSFIPTGNSTLTLTSTESIELKNYNITVTGTSELTGVIRTTFYTLRVVPEAPGFVLDLKPTDTVNVIVGEGATLKLTLTAIAEFNGEIRIKLLGLGDNMAWNSEVSPFNLSGQEQTLEIIITGLDETGSFDITIEITGANQTETSELTLKVTPKSEPDDDSDALQELYIIIIIIAVLLIILGAVSRMRFKVEPRSPDTKVNEQEQIHESDDKGTTQKKKQKIKPKD